MSENNSISNSKALQKKVEHNGKIDVIIPAYKAQKTILRTMASIVSQSIVDDLNVIIVNDCCPNGDYHEIVDMYSPYVSIKEIKHEKNAGPGVARQTGIDAGENEFFTCIDADDTFNGAIALEILRTAIEEMPPQAQQVGPGMPPPQHIYQCASGTFLQLGEDLKQIVPHQNDMVWMFGKLYRREFINRYKIRFNTTRANEDTGFNTMVRLLCNNEREQIRFVQEPVYYWHNKEDSITRINDGQYGHDQCFCGWTDNMIYAIEHVRSYRPFDGAAQQWTVNCMMQLYYYFIEVYARDKVFADQDWEYVKKFYHRCYKKIEEDINDQVFSEMFSMCSLEKWGSGSLIGIIPHIGIREFMDKLKKEEYNKNDIYKIWKRMWKDPETRKLMQNNIDCGVCPADYIKGDSTINL